MKFRRECLSGAILLLLSACATGPVHNSGHGQDWDQKAQVSTPPAFAYRSLSDTRFPATYIESEWESLTVQQKLQNLEIMVDEIISELQPWSNPTYYLLQIFGGEIARTNQLLKRAAPLSGEVQKALSLQQWTPAQEGFKPGQQSFQMSVVDQEVLRVVASYETIAKLMSFSRSLIYSSNSSASDKALAKVQKIMDGYSEIFLDSRYGGFGTEKAHARRLAEVRVLKLCLRYLYNQGARHLVSLREVSPSSRRSTPVPVLQKIVEEIFVLTAELEKELGGPERATIRHLNTVRDLRAKIQAPTWQGLSEMKSPSLVDIGDVDGSRGALENAILLQTSYKAVEFIVENL